MISEHLLAFTVDFYCNMSCHVSDCFYFEVSSVLHFAVTVISKKHGVKF